MPAIEVRHHGDGGVAEFRFAREFRFRHVGHADDRIAEMLVSEAFSQRGKLRTLDADIDPVAPDIETFGQRGVGKTSPQMRRYRMRHRYMRHASLAEERRLPQM